MEKITTIQHQSQVFCNVTIDLQRNRRYVFDGSVFENCIFDCRRNLFENASFGGCTFKNCIFKCYMNGLPNSFGLMDASNNNTIYMSDAYR